MLMLGSREDCGLCLIVFGEYLPRTPAIIAFEIFSSPGRVSLIGLGDESNPALLNFGKIKARALNIGYKINIFNGG